MAKTVQRGSKILCISEVQSNGWEDEDIEETLPEDTDQVQLIKDENILANSLRKWRKEVDESRDRQQVFTINQLTNALYWLSK